MNPTPDWAPPDIDTEQVSISRMYDYFLGGHHNFEVDRAFARQVVEVVPQAPEVARLNRAFLRRAVRFCVRQGIRQFLDIGSGIPTAGSIGNVHELAQSLDPACKVVYVDIEPVAVKHGQTILRGNDRAAMLEGELKDPDRLLAEPEVHCLLDFEAPLALLMLGVLHYVPDEKNPYSLVRRYRDLLVPGSYLVISHGIEGDRPMPVKSMINLTKMTETPGYMRTREEVEKFFDGCELVEPGVVFTPDWRPESSEDTGSETARKLAVAGVGRRTDRIAP